MTGRALGIDVGSVRVGVAMSDPGGILASPLATLTRDEAGGSDLDRVVVLVDEHEVVEVVVGLPRTLADRHGVAAEAAQAYADGLTARLSAESRVAAGSTAVPVRLHDERFSTVSAGRMLSGRGVKGRKQRAVIDQAAAVEILQSWLDGRRADR